MSRLETKTKYWDIFVFHRRNWRGWEFWTIWGWINNVFFFFFYPVRLAVLYCQLFIANALLFDLCFVASRWKNVYSSPSQSSEAGVSASSSAGYLKSTNKTILTSGSSGMALTPFTVHHTHTHTPSQAFTGVDRSAVTVCSGHKADDRLRFHAWCVWQTFLADTLLLRCLHLCVFMCLKTCLVCSVRWSHE